MSESKRYYLAAGILVFLFVLIAGSAGMWVFAEHRLSAEWHLQAAQHQALADAATQQIAVQNKALNELRQDTQRQRAAQEAMALELRNELATQRALIDQVRAAANAPVANGAPATAIQPRNPRGFIPFQPVGRMPRGQPKNLSWSADQVTGEPNSLNNGLFTGPGADSPFAWCPMTADAQAEWLILDYAEAVTINKVRVYENYYPGALTRVTTFDEQGNEVEGWSGKDPTPQGVAGRGISEVVFAAPRLSKRVKIYLDSVGTPGWNEIDAVGIVDNKDKTHWAVTAQASSSYADFQNARIVDLGGLEQGGLPDTDIAAAPLQGRAWGPEQLIGPPNTPVAGDQQTAWASRTQDGQPEWIVLDYEKSVMITKVQVHETYNPGALVKVSVFEDDGKEVVVWQGKDPTPVNGGMGTSEIVLATPRKAKKVKLYLDSVNVPGWNEIDAVGIVDDAKKTYWAVGAAASSTYAEQGQAFEPPPRRQADADQGQF